MSSLQRRAGVAPHLVATVVAGLPDADLRARGVAHDRHAPGREHVRGVHHDIAATRHRDGAGLGRVGARDVRRPGRAVGVAPARRHAGDLPALVQQQAVAAAARERLARRPAEEVAIEFRRPGRITAGEVDPADGARVVRVDRGHRIPLRAIRDERSVRFARRAVTSGRSQMHELLADAAARAGRYLDEIQVRPVAPSPAAVARLQGLREPFPAARASPATCSRCSTSSARRPRWASPARASSAS